MNLEELVAAALRLPPEARGALVRRLLDSLEGRELDADAEAAWEAELARRVKELDSGEVQTISWTEAKRRILRGE